MRLHARAILHLMFGFAFADVLEITDASGATTKVGVRAVDLADSAESRRELLVKHAEMEPSG
jgi:hypothetical protein